MRRYKCNWDPRKPLEGVISRLTCAIPGDPGNVHDEGLRIVVSASSCHPGAIGRPDYVTVLRDKRLFWVSAEEDCPWICYDFLQGRVRPTSYTLMSSPRPHDGYHLKSWVIEVSNDGNQWVEIDRQMNCDELNGPSATAHFDIPKDMSRGRFRYVRLTGAGPSHAPVESRLSNMHVFGLAAFEIFGTLFENSSSD